MKSKDPQPSKLRKDILCDKSHKRYVALQLLPSQNIRQLLRIKKKKKMVRRISKSKISQKFIRNSAVPHFMNLSKEC